MDRRIFALRKQMLSNLQHQPSVEEMAEKVEVTASYLQRLFKAETGMSPINYLRDLRLEKARELLGNSFLRIQQICYEVGIKDQSHFDKYFKEKFGVSPSEYRRQHQEKLEAEEADANK